MKSAGVEPAGAGNVGAVIVAEPRYRSVSPSGWRRFRINASRPTGIWLAATIAAAAAMLLPVAAVAISLLEGASDLWGHIASTVLPRYVINTLLLAIPVGLLSVLTGTGAAWLMFRYRFPTHRMLGPLLILPMAVPAYIGAFAYASFFDYSGPAQLFFRDFLGIEAGRYPVVPFSGLPAAVFILTIALYPYVYTVARASFRQQSGRLLEAAESLGLRRGMFLRLALPAARPALAAGAGLVLMETLNEFGTVAYLGVDTLTVGIFRVWFSYFDLRAARQIASLLLIAVFGILFLESLWRKGAGYGAGAPAAPSVPRRIRGIRGAAAAAFLWLLVALGFLFPVLILAAKLPYALTRTDPGPFAAAAFGSFAVAAAAAVLVCLTAILLAYGPRLIRSPALGRLVDTSTVGYAVPGAVIAVGVMSVTAMLDDLTGPFLGNGFPLLTGSFAGLLFAYLVRFLAIAFRPIQAGFRQIGSSIGEAGRSLGRPPHESLVRIELPLLSRTLVAASTLVFVDVLKELPLTMILRPFNFTTLAVRTYELASDERLAAASLPALLLVAAGTVTVIAADRLWGRSGKRGKP